MDAKQAMFILNGMIDKACDCESQSNDALRVALEALSAQLARENPQPLSLEELKARVGKPVFIAFPLDIEKGGWRLYEGFSQKCALFRGDYSLYIDGYGKTWLAYDHQPQL